MFGPFFYDLYACRCSCRLVGEFTALDLGDNIDCLIQSNIEFIRQMGKVKLLKVIEECFSLFERDPLGIYLVEIRPTLCRSGCCFCLFGRCSIRQFYIRFCDASSCCRALTFRFPELVWQAGTHGAEAGTHGPSKSGTSNGGNSRPERIEFVLDAKFDVSALKCNICAQCYRRIDPSLDNGASLGAGFDPRPGCFLGALADHPGAERHSTTRYCTTTESD